MSLRVKAILTATLLSISLAACGSKESEVKKPEEPALPEPKTGAAIDAAAEEAMVAAEKATDAEAETKDAPKGDETAKPADAKAASTKTE
jgi:hypothetical protein